MTSLRDASPLIFLLSLCATQSSVVNKIFFVHFHYASVYFYDAQQPLRASSVTECAEKCYYEKDECNAFEYNEDQSCTLHRIIEFNGSVVPSVYIKNVKQLPLPSVCYTEAFAQKIISELGLSPCLKKQSHYSRAARKCYFGFKWVNNYKNYVLACSHLTPHQLFEPVVINNNQTYQELMSIHYLVTVEFIPVCLSGISNKQFGTFATGLTRADVTSPWRWENGEPLHYTNWAPGQPSTNGNCMMVNGNGTWSTYNCDVRILITVICQGTPYPQLRKDN